MDGGKYIPMDNLDAVTAMDLVKKGMNLSTEGSGKSG
jgi:hypothetical protein